MNAARQSMPSAFHALHRAIRFAIATALLSLLLIVSARSASAQTAQIVLADGLIGAGFGAAIGIAQAHMGSDRDERMQRVPMLAAIGAVLGMMAGGLEVSGAFARYDAESGRVAWGMAVPRIVRREANPHVELGLLNVNF